MSRISGTGLGGADATLSGLTQIKLISGGDATGSHATIGAYDTIQDAVNAVPAATGADSIRTVYSILIPPGTYDENLAIDITNRHIQLVALGAVNIGLFNNTFWAASNTRNITITCSAGAINSIRSTFGMGTYIPYATASSTHPAYSSAIRLSGSIIYNVTSVAFVDIDSMISADIFGDIDSSSAATHNFHMYLVKCKVRGQVKGARNLLQFVDYSTFTGLVTCRAYSTIRNSSIEGGMTVSIATSAGLNPFGMVGTYFAGTFTGPLASMVLDGTSSYYFTSSGASLAGGATQVIIESASGSGITQLTGDVTAGPGSGSVVATIANNVVTNAKLAQMPANTVKANITSGTANATDVALLTTATNNSVAQRDSSGQLTATAFIAPLHKAPDGAGTAVTLAGGTAASNGNGGNANVTGAAGSSVSTGGNGGNIALTAGAAGGDNTVNQSGGSVTFTAGTSKGSSQGGGLTINLGTGGPGTGTAGATGGTNNINAGTGGVGSATSGNGGNSTINAGSGGAGVGGGSGGTATLHGGNAGTGSSTSGNGGPANVTGGSAGGDGSAGGAVSLAAAGGSGTGTGGAGGTATITGGTAGGDNTVNRSGGSVTITAGNSKGSQGGPNVNITAGAGGVGTGTAGANGGTVAIAGGAGGLGSATGGTGGSVTVTGGSAPAVASGAGGAVIIAGAVGSSTGAGGAGGQAQLNGGNANGDNTQNNAGGNVTLTAGNSKGSSTGGTMTLTSGAGGLGTGTAGANGGAFAITGGAGGLGSATGGTGATITISAGLGGASGTPGAGGDIIFRTAATTSITEHLRVGANGNVTVTAGNLLINTLGNGLQVKTGTNSKLGTVALVGGAATVANTSVTANSRIFVTSQADGGTVGFLRITAKTVGTSFVITSSSVLDTSTVAWNIIESIP